MRRLGRILLGVYDAFYADDGPALAGYIAFSALLGLFPFMILATSIAAMAFGVDRGNELTEAMFQFAPPHVVQTLAPVLHDVLENSTGSVLTVSALAALWFSSNAVEALRTGFDRAYRTRPRGIIPGRLRAFAVVLLGVVAVMALGVTIVFGPLIETILERRLDFPLPAWLDATRYAAGLAIFILFLVFLHRFLPGHSVRYAHLWPGVVISTVIWLVAATAFSIYLGYTPTYVSTYGALAGIVITLMFFYITGIAVILGAEINAVLNRTREAE